jgi:hypothetical protein
MQEMLRGLVGLTSLLLASVDPAAAMDQSATEETNCLMACDSNQENCRATGHGSAGKSRPHEVLSLETRLSRSLRTAANFSHVDRGTPPKERLHLLLGNRQ